MVKAVLFDIDGVIIRHRSFFAHTLPRWRYRDPGPVMDSFYRSPTNHACDQGALDPFVEMRPFLDRMGWKGSVESYLRKQYRFEAKSIDRSLLKAIDALRARGLHCSIASNQNRHRREWLREELGAAIHFDRAFFSSELGCAKPDPAFWEKAYAALSLDIPGIAPEDVVFMDDMPQNVAGAEAFGFRGFAVSCRSDIDAAFEFIHRNALNRDSFPFERPRRKK